MLEELAGIGMRLARDVERRALADEPRRDALPDRARVNNAGADWGLVFARIARAVRQTVALEARLASDAEARTAVGSAARAGRAAAEQKRVRRLKDQVRRLAEEAIAAEAEGPEAENLRYDLDERLEDPEIEAELGSRPIGVIFAGICRDLGIDADLSHFTDAELGFDTAAMRAVPRSGAEAEPGSAELDRGVGLSEGSGIEIDVSADTGFPAVSRSPASWPARFGAGRDPP